MFFIEDIDFLSQSQKNKIEDIFKNQNTPFYFTNDAAKIGDGCSHFLHHVIRDGEKNSSMVPMFVDILDTFCKKHNITYTKIHRCAVNVTFNVGKSKTEPHVDHTFPHKQLIVYLNQPEGGDTIILNDNNTPFKIVSPEKWKGIMFDSNPHYQHFPMTGIRIITIITFS
jgi:hypothetical protein